MSDDDGNLEVDIYLRGQLDDMECYGTMPPLAEASCRYLLNHMSAGDHMYYFGPSSDPDPLDYELPRTILSRG